MIKQSKSSKAHWMHAKTKFGCIQKMCADAIYVRCYDTTMSVHRKTNHIFFSSVHAKKKKLAEFGLSTHF